MAIPIESSPPPGWDREGIDGLLGLFPPGPPRGRRASGLSDAAGPGSSGGTSLLLALIARITTRGQVAYVDGMDALDPASAATAGVDLSALLWVECAGRLTPAPSSRRGGRRRAPRAALGEGCGPSPHGAERRRSARPLSRLLADRPRPRRPRARAFRRSDPAAAGGGRPRRGIGRPYCTSSRGQPRLAGRDDSASGSPRGGAASGPPSRWASLRGLHRPLPPPPLLPLPPGERAGCGGRGG